MSLTPAKGGPKTTIVLEAAPVLENETASQSDDSFTSTPVQRPQELLMPKTPYVPKTPAALPALKLAPSSTPVPPRPTQPKMFAEPNTNFFSPAFETVCKKRKRISLNLRFHKHRVSATSTTDRWSFRLKDDFEWSGSLKAVQDGRGVARCKHMLDGCEYAIKTIQVVNEDDDTERTAVLSEIFAHAALSKHPCVVRYHSSWYDADKSTVNIQMEHCSHGTLLTKKTTSMSALSQAETLGIIFQLAQSIKTLHTEEMAHLSIDPLHILLGTPSPEDKVCWQKLTSISEKSESFPGYVCKLTSFRHVARVGESATNPQGPKTFGDVRYAARELLENRELNNVVLKACDIFSLGLTILELTTGMQVEMQGSPQWESLRRVRSEQDLLSLAGFSRLSAPLRHLLAWMMQENPTQRPTASDILEHPALQQFNGDQTQALDQIAHKLALQLEACQRRRRVVEANSKPSKPEPRPHHGLSRSTYQLSSDNFLSSLPMSPVESSPCSTLFGANDLSCTPFELRLNPPNFDDDVVMGGGHNDDDDDDDDDDCAISSPSVFARPAPSS